MEIKFLQKKKVFKKVGSQIRPDLYWGYILLLVFIIIFVSLVLGFLLFIKVNKESELSIESTGGQESIKKERLDEALKFFENRKNKSIEILNSPSPIIDPSL